MSPTRGTSGGTMARTSVERGCRRSTTEGEAVVALANPDDLDQVLDVIVDNAIAYAPGPIELRTERNGSSAL